MSSTTLDPYSLSLNWFMNEKKTLIVFQCIMKIHNAELVMQSVSSHGLKQKKKKKNGSHQISHEISMLKSWLHNCCRTLSNISAAFCTRKRLSSEIYIKMFAPSYALDMAVVMNNITLLFSLSPTLLAPSSKIGRVFNLSCDSLKVDKKMTRWGVCYTTPLILSILCCFAFLLLFISATINSWQNSSRCSIRIPSNLLAGASTCLRYCQFFFSHFLFTKKYIQQITIMNNLYQYVFIYFYLQIYICFNDFFKFWLKIKIIYFLLTDNSFGLQSSIPKCCIHKPCNSWNRAK